MWYLVSLTLLKVQVEKERLQPIPFRLTSESFPFSSKAGAHSGFQCPEYLNSLNQIKNQCLSCKGMSITISAVRCLY